jgi:hypothetical protein
MTVQIQSHLHFKIIFVLQNFSWVKKSFSGVVEMILPIPKPEFVFAVWVELTSPCLINFKKRKRSFADYREDKLQYSSIAAALDSTKLAAHWCCKLLCYSWLPTNLVLYCRGKYLLGITSHVIQHHLRALKMRALCKSARVFKFKLSFTLRGFIENFILSHNLKFIFWLNLCLWFLSRSRCTIIGKRLTQWPRWIRE